MKIAARMSRLGTETAFAVGAEAAELAKTGIKIYPFHLGDMNIITPQNIRNAASQALEGGKTGYCPNAGIPQLREALAKDVGTARGLDLSFENVTIQPGGKPIISKFIQVLMEVGDEVLYPNPGYPIYESQIDYHGGKAVPYSFKETETGFELDIDQIERSITPKTSILIFNNYQNPISASASDEEMQRLADLCLKHNFWVLADEAYFDMNYEGQGKSITSLPGIFERSVILYTFSKKFAMTGWRLGAAIGPREIVDHISRINTNDESCSNHFIQWAAIEALQGDQSGSKKILDVLKERRDTAVDLLNSMPGIKTHRPDCTFYLYPNVTEAMKKSGISDVEAFRKLVLVKTGVSFCTRRHFGTPQAGETENYIRLAYSGIDSSEIKEGLEKMKTFLLS
ncbi:MAG: aminotransferase class I/II-fold pyridoxal phosphate-dependent enzyme [Deltaproteobacteria bacterium]|nr:aminotransferase class I/II-fold pyridoxal phosphate-dependent enzyme [Deltaproteobacteria bacterium]